MRDLTEPEFLTECRRRGWVPQPYLGYIAIGNVHFPRTNGGKRRRKQLAWLDEQEKRHASNRN